MFSFLIYVSKATYTYFKYMYYGIKQRCRALYYGEITIMEFLKSLIRVPVEAYIYTGITLKAQEDSNYSYQS